MSLKTLISIKFIFYIVFLSLIILLTNNINKEFGIVEKQNANLIRQKEYYEQIMKLEPSDTKSKESIHNSIKISESFRKLRKEPAMSLNSYLMLLVITTLGGATITNILDNKIKNEKTKINDKGELL